MTARHGSPDAAGHVTIPSPASPADRLLTPGEVAALLRVDPKTVTRWAQSGKLASMRTPGGHRRYSEAEVRTYLATSNTPESRPPGTPPRPRTAHSGGLLPIASHPRARTAGSRTGRRPAAQRRPARGVLDADARARTLTWREPAPPPASGISLAAAARNGAG